MTERSIIEAIDRYLAKADDDLTEILDDEDRAIPKESVEMEEFLEAAIAAALLAQTDYFIRQIKRHKSVADVLMNIEEIKAADECSVEIAAAVSEQFQKYIPKMTVNYAFKIDEDVKITSMSKRTTAWIDSWSKQLAELMKLNSHKEIEDILKNALLNGDSVPVTARKILTSGIRDEYYKAHRVAMTELFRAQNVAKQEALMQSPTVVSKMWRHLGIGKPRPNHVAMNGKTVPKDQPFTLAGADGGTYYPMYPVDPSLPPGESINCHCICEAVTDENIMRLSAEERQKLRDEAVAKLDEEWERELADKYKAMVGYPTSNGKKTLDNSGESGIIESEMTYRTNNSGKIITTRSISGEYEIKLPDGSSSYIKNPVFDKYEVFAGKGSDKELRVRDFLVENYGGKSENWFHAKGYTEAADVNGNLRKANIHWFEEETIGIVEMKVKGWSKK